MSYGDYTRNMADAKAEGAAEERERIEQELRQCLNHIRMANNNIAAYLEQQGLSNSTVTKLVNQIERNVMRAVNALREANDDN